MRLARGNEPFWAVSIEGDEARISSPDLPEGMAYRDGRWTRGKSAGTWEYKARRERAEGLWLELELTEAPCTDSMSGNASPFTAVLTYDGKRVEGCAS